mmetsp:Transcript_66421/g.155708  ORF Transcript_66421/g.155708 Transcript_66421/m.155708 type:complete len:204 (+) Transcript_66421:1107-1718(+)
MTARQEQQGQGHPEDVSGLKDNKSCCTSFKTTASPKISNPMPQEVKPIDRSRLKHRCVEQTTCKYGWKCRSRENEAKQQAHHLQSKKPASSSEVSSGSDWHVGIRKARDLPQHPEGTGNGADYQHAYHQMASPSKLDEFHHHLYETSLRLPILGINEPTHNNNYCRSGKGHFAEEAKTRKAKVPIRGLFQAFKSMSHGYINHV